VLGFPGACEGAIRVLVGRVGVLVVRRGFGPPRQTSCFRIDRISRRGHYTGWTENDSGDKHVRRELRSVLKEYGLPINGQRFDKTYEYVRESYQLRP
jgi:hypothetical protein